MPMSDQPSLVSVTTEANGAFTTYSGEAVSIRSAPFLSLNLRRMVQGNCTRVWSKQIAKKYSPHFK